MATIKDSGERTEFASGAVRDMHEGKGRMDLLLWAALWKFPSIAKLVRNNMANTMWIVASPQAPCAILPQDIWQSILMAGRTKTTL
jgi:hypothetical protein